MKRASGSSRSSAATSASRRSRSAFFTVAIAPSIRPERANWLTIDWATMFGEMYVFVAIPWICLITACGPTR